jgi:xanthine dehydrogenase accessory factor
LVRGAGDLATGVLHRLFIAGYRVGALEIAHPRAVRRSACFSEAVYDCEAVVEGVTARLVESDEFRGMLGSGAQSKTSESENDTEQYRVSADATGHRPEFIPVVIDPEGKTVLSLAPDVVVDARMLKRRGDICIDDAPLVIGLGPGLLAGEDVDVVIETWRGQSLGKCIWKGYAASDTGVPAPVDGYGGERVLLSPADGVFEAEREMGEMVENGELIGRVGECELRAETGGLLRGLIRSGLEVRKKEKLGDVDPRGRAVDHKAISDKARAVAGGVLEAVLSRGHLP